MKKLYNWIVASFYKFTLRKPKRELYKCNNCGTEINYRCQTIYQGKKYGLKWHSYIKCPACKEKIWID